MLVKQRGIVFFLISIVLIAIFTLLVYNENTSSYVNYNTLTRDYKILLDRNNDILVNVMKTYSLYIIPNRVNDFNHLIENLVNILQLEKNTLQNKILNSNSITLIKEELNYNEIQELKKLNLNCLLLMERLKRIYQYKNFAVDIIGYEDNNKILDGIEYFYISESSNKQENASIDNVMKLTIDKNIQMTLENYLKNIKFKPNFTLSVIIMSSDTGEIISLTNIPQTKLSKDNSILVKYPNYAITSLFRPTPIILLLNELIENKNTHNFEVNTINELNLANIDHIKLRHDSLVQILETEQRKNQIVSLLIQLGFGQKTGIDLPFENTGFFQYDPIINNSNLLFATPIQILVAYNSIIKNGKIIKPLLNTNAYNKENIRYISSNEINWSKNSEIIKGFKNNKFLYISEIITNNENDNELILLGHYPLENPRISFIIAAKRIEFDYFISHQLHNKIFDLVQMASKIKFLNTDLDFKTSREIKKDTLNEIMPDLTGLPLRTGINLLSGSCRIQIEGEGNIISQLPKPGTKLDNSTICKLKLSNTI